MKSGKAIRSLTWTPKRLSMGSATCSGNCQGDFKSVGKFCLETYVDRSTAKVGVSNGT